MKRYLLFAYESYYPSGGKNDEVGSYDTLEEAVAAANTGTFQNYDYKDILDLEKREWVTQ